MRRRVVASMFLGVAAVTAAVWVVGGVTETITHPYVQIGLCLVTILSPAIAHKIMFPHGNKSAK